MGVKSIALWTVDRIQEKCDTAVASQWLHIEPADVVFGYVKVHLSALYFWGNVRGTVC